MQRILIRMLIPLVLGQAVAFSGSDAPSIDQGPGVRTSFNADWLFARFGAMPDGSMKQEPVGLEGRSIDDGQWRRLDLPHDWGIEGPFRGDLPSNTGKLPWVGIGWYRKHFAVSGSDRGKLFFVDFDGAMSHAKVWLNGHYLGEWPYGYASFRFELTPYIRFGEENVLAVRLDNPPNSSRWYPGGGIYRNVWFETSAPVHLAHWGTVVTTPRIENDRATVGVKAGIRNESETPAEVTIVATIGASGEASPVVSIPAATITVPPHATQQWQTEALVHSPRLWNLESPNLYTLRTTLMVDDRVIDTAQTVFGIRTAEFTADNGFLLNGRRVQINGTCNHHDLGPLGAAVNVKALARQIRLLKEMGGNAIRTSHNPPAPELLDLCDRMGMLVLDEAFDCWVEGKTPNDYSTLFKEWHKKDIRALVDRDRNHPSVIAWSCGNEVREQANGELAGKLRALFHAEDPTRPVTAACDNPQAGFDGFQDSVDIFGYNYKPRLYAKFHRENPSKPLFGSETASCVSSYGEYFFPVSDDKSKGAFDNQVSSYDLSAPPWATIPDVEFAAQDSNGFVAGEFVWTGFDYLGEPTPFGDDTSRSRSSYFGILDLCGFKKDRFYLYQARWRPDLPMAHILPHWNWPDRVGKVTPVHVYTSGDEAELFLNGKSLGRKKKAPYEYRLRWDDVRYEPGKLEVVAYKNGREWARDVMQTTGPAARIEILPEDTTLTADGADLAYLRVRVVDRDSLRVPTADNLIRFTVKGPGLLAAVGNGDATEHDSFHADRYRAFNGQCLLIVRAKKGERGLITVTAGADGLVGRTLEILSR